MVDVKVESLGEEFARLVHEYNNSEAGSSVRAEAWNLIADFAVENSTTIRSTLSDAVAEREAEPVATLCTLGVGDGSGKLFVHGDYDSIKAAQAIIFQANEATSDLEALRKRVAELEKALIECDEYFDNRADADHDGIGFVANEEMKLQMMIRRVREGGKVDAP